MRPLLVSKVYLPCLLQMYHRASAAWEERMLSRGLEGSCMLV